MKKGDKVNFNRVANEKARKLVDPFINALAADLSGCYYKHWKLGNPKDFYGYDVKNAVEESKKQFDKLHGLIYRLHSVVLHQHNMKLNEQDRYPASKYDDITGDEGNVIGSHSANNLSTLKQETPHFINLKNALKDKMSREDIKTGDNTDYTESERRNLKSIVDGV